MNWNSDNGIFGHQVWDVIPWMYFCFGFKLTTILWPVLLYHLWELLLQIAKVDYDFTLSHTLLFVETAALESQKSTMILSCTLVFVSTTAMDSSQSPNQSCPIRLIPFCVLMDPISKNQKIFLLAEKMCEVYTQDNGEKDLQTNSIPMSCPPRETWTLECSHV